MTADAIVNMAQQAGYPHVGLRWNDQELSFLERFAAIVAAKEREACAQVCDAELLRQHARIAEFESELEAVEQEPLTHAQAKALVLKYGNDPLHLVYQVEVAHGIKKGGQHGAE